MTLTMGEGPLSRRPATRRNFTVEAPAHRLLLEDYPHRLRAVVGGQVVLDSTRARLLHETGRQVVPYVPLDDFDASMMQRSETTTHCRYKGDASFWSLTTPDGVVEDAVWAYEQPIDEAGWLRGMAALTWDAADTWLVEDDAAFGPHLRNPYHRVDVFETSRQVTVRVDDRVIARSRRAKLLSETGLPLRAYVPLGDVEAGVLVGSETRTECPYKGEARYYGLDVDGRRFDDAAWMYPTPLPEAMKVAGHVCFLADDIHVDVAAPGDVDA